ncbi:hypothetical protein SGPA1_30323 [Streptomyces misionensis JCM 4497]
MRCCTAAAGAPPAADAREDPRTRPCGGLRVVASGQLSEDHPFGGTTREREGALTQRRVSARVLCRSQGAPFHVAYREGSGPDLCRRRGRRRHRRYRRRRLGRGQRRRQLAGRRVGQCHPGPDPRAGQPLRRQRRRHRSAEPGVRQHLRQRLTSAAVRRPAVHPRIRRGVGGRFAVPGQRGPARPLRRTGQRVARTGQVA